MTDTSSAHARVRAVLAAARLLADPTHELGREARARLPEVTGLSPRGVDLGLTEHLELDATADDIQTLIESVPPAKQAHVVLSANVFVAASRAIALALASTAQVFVRPSRREPVTARLMARALEKTAPIEIVDDIEPKLGDCVHVYGHDATIDAFRAALEPDVPVWGHGAGFGVAVLDGEGLDDEQLAHAIEHLTRDIVVFDQRGCLSPRALLFRGTEPQLDLVTQQLVEQLERSAAETPVGEVDDEDRIQRRSYLDVMASVGLSYEVSVGGVGVDLAPSAITVPGSPRTMHIARVDDVTHALRLLSPIERAITALGGEGHLFEAIASEIHWARRSRLGDMQRPRLDGPVDRRGSMQGRWTSGPIAR
ncbi:MAG: acyl-CoA reductase [Polyangiaceae bacterium]